MRLSFIIAILTLAAGTACCADRPDNSLSISLALSQTQAQALALERNHDLALIKASIASAQANLLAAAAPPNPILSLSTGSIDPGGHNGAGSLWRKRVDSIASFSQLIERGGKRELRQEHAQHNVRAADADWLDLRRQLRLLVAHAYADLHAAQDKLAAMRDAAELMDAMLSAAQVRRKSGDLAGADLERVRVDALRARNEVAGAKAERQRAQRALALLLGENEQADRLEAIDSWPSLDEAALLMAQTVATSVDRRPDVLAATARISAATAGTKLAESSRTRDVSVGVQFEHFPQPGDKGNAAGNSIGVSVQLPLFVRYNYEGEVAASLAALDAARENLARIRAVAEADLSISQSALKGAAERVTRNRDELLVAAEKAAAATEYAYRNGAIGVTDMLDARRTLRISRQDALTALADLSKALASWRAANETTEFSR